MNIFYLSKNPTTAALFQCDKHVVKMILETAQMLCTAHHINGTDLDVDDLYKVAHRNHPSTIWARTSEKNYDWLYKHFIALCNEYFHRYKKIHATDRKLRCLLAQKPKYFPQTAFSHPPQCMPDTYKSSSTVEAYRNYYYYDKRRFAKYTNRKCPVFMV